LHSTEFLGLIPLTGTGVRAPVASVAPTGLAFGSQVIGTTSAPMSVTVTNTGNADLHVSSAGIGGANAGDFAIASNGCGTVAPSANCRISVTFTPSASGARSASLTITDDAAGSPRSVALSGQGKPSTDLQLSMTDSPDPVRRGANLTYTITVKNAGPD